MQTADTGDLLKRARYYSSCIDLPLEQVLELQKQITININQ
ncbi:hypothetical protein [Treponema sp.]|nr:hypothetical protein [Treponema sp.]